MINFDEPVLPANFYQNEKMTSPPSLLVILIVYTFCRGFSTVVLIEDESTHKKYALKKIICHGIEDEAQALREIKYHSLFEHPSIIHCVDSFHRGTPDPVVNATSEVLIVLPYYHVSSCFSFNIAICNCICDDSMKIWNGNCRKRLILSVKLVFSERNISERTRTTIQDE